MRIKFSNRRNPRLSLWREWYAWRPVKVGEQWVWFETLEKRYVWAEDGYDHYQTPEYRYIADRD